MGSMASQPAWHIIAALTLGLRLARLRVVIPADRGPALRRSSPEALLGYLPWNFNPAKVFIGTTGVMVMGYLLAVLAILGSAKVAVALLILGVPIIDTFWIITRRHPRRSLALHARPRPHPPPPAGPRV